MSNSGLTKEEVVESRKKYGSNEITSVKRSTFSRLFLEALGDPIIKILLLALGIKVIFLFRDFDWYETIGIVIAILIATFVSTISEYGSDKAFASLQAEASKIMARVRRDNKVSEIVIDEIVVGDIVLLDAGNKIPADGYLIDGTITVDESVLNGETKEVRKVAYKIGEIKENNRVFRGSTVYSDVASMLVVNVGKDTVYGRIADEIQESDPISPLKERLTGLAKIISRIGYVGAFFVTIAYLFSVIVIDNNYDINLIKETVSNIPLLIDYMIHALTLSVTIIVVAVPEGLPMMITLVLSSNMKRMLKNNVLVRKLVGIETAGNINVLLTDKTGTLTKGKLEISNILLGDLCSFNKRLFNRCRYKEMMYEALYYNSDSMFDDKGMVVGGNSTDRAIMEYIGDYKQKEKKILDKKHFHSSYKYASVTVSDGSEITYYKGAGEVLLKKCYKYINENGEEKFLRNYDTIIAEIEKATKRGMRVIVLAYKKNSRTFSDLVFMGLVYLKDELRDEAIVGVRQIKSAGIQVIMITGDACDTAKVIAEEVGILQHANELILTSDEMNKLSDEELKSKLKDLRVVARALPTDKSRLVRITQEMNLIVSMTGDGVNDAPALRKANVGFAMGSGTEVSKEAGDIVILDDNILSISKAILYGRTIFKSIRKFIIYQLSVNMTALCLSIIGPFIGFSSPITIIQMLWLNMIMDTFAALAFSYEPALDEYMEEPPKRKDEPIMNYYMYNEISLTAIYSATLCILFLKLPLIKQIFRIGNNNIYLMTAYFALFIFIGIFNAFNARTYRINIFANILKNRVFLAIITFIIIVQVYLIYFGGDLFRTYGLTSKEFFLILMIALSVWPVDAFRKIYLKNKGINRSV